MIRSLLGGLILFFAIFFMPVWAQIVLFVGAVFLLPNRWVFVIPAVVYDTVYSNSYDFAFSNFKMTIIVLIAIVVSEIMIRTMRVEKYVLEK